MLFPQDVLERVFLFLGHPEEIVRCGEVCSSFYKAATAPHVWQELAHLRFGKELAEQSLSLYRGSWKELVKDDNKRGALPTLSQQQVCMYKYNRPEYFFCCIVKCVKWDRVAGQIQVHIDVRGETDLRRPIDSSSVVRNQSGRVMQALPLARFDQAVRFDPHQPGTRRHCKGCLIFPAPSMAGTYIFCYANRAYAHANRPDYIPIPLFDISPEGGLKEAFQLGDDSKTYYTSNLSPFADDTPQVERARWEAVVPAEVMNRQHTWYEM